MPQLTEMDDHAQKTIPEKRGRDPGSLDAAVRRSCALPRRGRRNPSAVSVLVIRHGLPTRPGIGCDRQSTGV